MKCDDELVLLSMGLEMCKEVELCMDSNMGLSLRWILRGFIGKCGDCGFVEDCESFPNTNIENEYDMSVEFVGNVFVAMKEDAVNQSLALTID